MLLNRVNEGRERVLEEVDNPLEVQFWTQNVEEYILTIALVELCNYV